MLLGLDHQPRGRLPGDGGEHRRLRYAGPEAGTTAPVFLGGSNIGIPVNSENQELALDLVKVLVSSGFQKQFAEAGTIPALKSELAA